MLDFFISQDLMRQVKWDERRLDSQLGVGEY